MEKEGNTGQKMDTKKTKLVVADSGWNRKKECPKEKGSIRSKKLQLVLSRAGKGKEGGKNILPHLRDQKQTGARDLFSLKHSM